MKRSSQILAITAVVVAGLFAACTAPGASPAPSPSPTTNPSSPAPTPTPDTSSTPAPSATPAPGVEVTTAAQAAAIVFASEPRYARMTPLRADMVGQSAWYEAFADGDGFTVAVTLGSGDCQAGCIDQHTWTYDVDRAGNISLVSEEGDEVEYSPPQGTDAPVTVTVSLLASPICPVEQNPPDPNCAPRPVADADVILNATDGHEVARATSDAEGKVTFEVEPGAYYVDAADVEGLMREPDAQAFSAVGGDSVGLLLGYDTGIR